MSTSFAREQGDQNATSATQEQYYVILNQTEKVKWKICFDEKVALKVKESLNARTCMRLTYETKHKKETILMCTVSVELRAKEMFSTSLSKNSKPCRIPYWKDRKPT